MSMNGVDYTKQMARERDYFQDAARKAKEGADKRVDDANKRVDHAIEKQKQTHIEDRAELEKKHEKALENIKEQTEAKLANNDGKINEEREKERQQFTTDMTKKRKDFEDRLTDIKASYKKAFDSETNRHEELEKSSKKKYNQNVTGIRDNLDNKLKDYQEKMTGAGADLKDQYSRERSQLVRAHEDRVTEAYTDASNKRAELKDRIDNEFKKTKEVKDAELDQLKRYSDNRYEKLQKHYQDRNEVISKDYSSRNDQLVDATKEQQMKTNREHMTQVSEMRRGFNDQMKRIELEKRRRDNGSGDFAEFNQKQRGVNQEILHNNKVKHLQNELVEAQKGYQYRAEREQDANKHTLKEYNAEAVAREERKLNEAKADKLVTFSKERERSEREIANREHQNNLDKSAYEGQLMVERNNANERLNRLKDNFNKSLQSLEEKHKTALDEVTKSSNKDKTDYIKGIQQRRSDEIFEMKRAFSKMMDATVQDYEQRIATYQRENEYLKLNMNQKVANIIDQTEKQLQSQKTLFDDRRTADMKSQQVLMDQRESQLKRNFSDMNLNYQKKIDKMMVENDTKFKLMTNEYETKLKEQKALASKELTSKETAHQIELDRVKQAYEDEKNRIVNSYESQIEASKNGHEAQLRQMADYKRLT